MFANSRYLKWCGLAFVEFPQNEVTSPLLRNRLTTGYLAVVIHWPTQ